MEAQFKAICRFVWDNLDRDDGTEIYLDDVEAIIGAFLEEVKRSTMRPPWGVDLPNFGRFRVDEGLCVEFEETPKDWGKYILLPKGQGGEDGMSVDFDADAEMFGKLPGPLAPGKTDAQLAEERLRRIEGMIKSLIQKQEQNEAFHDRMEDRVNALGNSVANWVDTLAGRVRALEERSADDGK